MRKRCNCADNVGAHSLRDIENVPSVSPVEMKRYLELKSRMEHSDKSNMRRQVGFSSEAG